MLNRIIFQLGETAWGELLLLLIHALDRGKVRFFAVS
jgi:hypothetical protein